MNEMKVRLYATVARNGLAVSEIPLNKLHPDIGKTAQGAIEQAVSEFGRRLLAIVAGRE